MAQKSILITGMSGLIGGVLRKHLEGRYHLSALNRRQVTGVECICADIADLKAIEPAFKGKDVVVHLAAEVRGDAPWESILPINIVGTYNVFEAARRAGVRRVVFASTGSVIANWEMEPPYNAIAQGRYQDVPKPWPMITHLSPVRPFGLYGCSKVWGEALGRFYSDAYGLSVLCLRIGAVLPDDRPRPNMTRDLSVWCSHRDLASLFELCIEAPDSLKYDIFYAVSNNKWNYRDISHAREVLGFVPQDNAEVYRGRTK